MKYSQITVSVQKVVWGWECKTYTVTYNLKSIEKEIDFCFKIIWNLLKLSPPIFLMDRIKKVLSHRIYVENSISQSDKESPIVKSPWDKVWFGAQPSSSSSPPPL